MFFSRQTILTVIVTASMKNMNYMSFRIDMKRETKMLNGRS